MASHSKPKPKARVSGEAAGRAVDAVLKWLRARAKQRRTAELLPGGHGGVDHLYLVLTLKKIPHRGRTNAFRIHLPHPLFDSSASVCLLVDDRPKTPLSPAAARDLVHSLSLPVSHVLSLSDLRSDYHPFEARRILADSHDLFLADRRVLHLLPGLLGKHFFRRKKIPVPLDLSRDSWPEQLLQCCASTFLYLRSGTCSAIKVGRSSQARDDIVDNVLAAIEGAVEHVPRKWSNVRSFHLKAAESLSLPIYQALPELGLKIEGLPLKKQAEEENMNRAEGYAIKDADEDDTDGEKEKEGKSKKGAAADNGSKKRKIKENKLKDGGIKGTKRSKLGRKVD